MRPVIKELILPLTVALIHGIIYLFMVPPWQHYDEPGHMEYVWHIAHKEQLPLPEDIDRNMRFDFFESMVRHGFFGRSNPPPTVDRVNGPTPDIGYVQLEDSPVYYVGPALAVLFVREQPIEVQLYAARSVSLLLLLLCVICAWGTARELTSPGHATRWMLPLSIALLPPFVDLMTAVNSDTGAIAAYSLFIWGATRLIMRNSERRESAETILTVVWIVAAATLCLAIKSSTASAILLTVPVVILGLIPRRYTGMGIALVGVLIIGCAIAAFRGGDAQAWYRTEATARDPLTRCSPPECAQTVHGTHAIRVAPEGRATGGRLLQSFPPDFTARLRGKTVTIAGWAWTDGATANGKLPWLSANYAPDTAPETTLTKAPTFFAYTRTLPANTHYLRLTLNSPPGIPVFLDGLMVIAGEPPQDRIPVILDADALQISWGGAVYDNMVRNASAENSAPGLRPVTQMALDQITPSWMIWPLGISSIFDLRGSGWYYALVARNMFESFWGRFAWGQVALPWPAFPIILALCVLCLAAAGGRMLGRPLPPANTLAIAGIYSLATLSMLLPGSMRGISTGLEVSLWLPGSRYLYPAVIACLVPITLSAGTLATAASTSFLPRVCVIAWVTLSLAALVTVAVHFWWPAG